MAISQPCNRTEAGPGCQLSCPLCRAGWTPSTATSPPRCAGGPRCRAEQRRWDRERQAPASRESCRCRLSQSSSQFGQRRSGARLPCDQHSRHHPSAVPGHVAVSTGVEPGADDPAGAYCAAGWHLRSWLRLAACSSQLITTSLWAPGTTHSPGPVPLISPAADHWPPAQGPDGHAGDSWAPGQVGLRGHVSHPCWVMPVIRFQVNAGSAQGKGSVADR
jgi:hypothetical protein